ncbi:MAG: substrate-binding domain-containing protein [Firmicutes bacterium]|nr:substrate-binding domain-containing protein [Bacillota bacterium]
MTETALSLGITYANYPVIDGSTSTLRIVRAIWEAMNEEGTNAYEAGLPREAAKTMKAYDMLIEGEADMIIVPYASDDVFEKAKEAGVELEFHKIAEEALIFITPKENSAENITEEQIRSIYLDYGIKNWKELGGPNRELVPICRNSDSGSQAQMDNLVLRNEPMHPDIEKNYVELTMEGLLEQVAFYHGGGFFGEPTESYALGYTLYTYLENMNKITGIGENLKILSYNGIAPTEESIADGSYPLCDGYYSVMLKSLPEEHSARIITDWLKSSEGAEAIQDTGLIPAKA